MDQKLFKSTNATSTGIDIDRKVLKALLTRSDRPGLVFLLQWAICLLFSGYAVYATLGSAWVWLSMFVFGTIITVPNYALSHETAHGTAFKTQWLNQLSFYVTSFIYGEEPLHRHHLHTKHHNNTWHPKTDPQMPFETPMNFRGWIEEISGLGLLKYCIRANWQLATKNYSTMTLEGVPKDVLPKCTHNARIFIALYLSIFILILLGQTWLLWFVVIPRLFGAAALGAFALIQHVEMQENSYSIIESTRSFKTGFIGSFLYMNMQHHIEHHLYSRVPFHKLPELHEAIKDKLPEPDPGFWKTNADVLSVVIRRSLGRNTKASVIRQAPHMVSEGGYQKISERTM